MAGFFEEGFRGHGEVFGVVGRTVFVQYRAFAGGRHALKAIVPRLDHLGPSRVTIGVLQKGNSVGTTTGLIQLMGEFVHGHVVTIEAVAGALQHRVPSEHDGSVAG